MTDEELNNNSSRVEKILGAMTGDYSGELDPPLSRVERLLLKLAGQIEVSGNKTSLKFAPVDSLPATGEDGTFYLVKKKKADPKDPYDIYTWSEGKFIKIDNPDIEMPTLSAVATSGSYNDLKDKPSIPEDTNTTYIFTFDDDILTITPSDGSEPKTIDLSSLKDDTNTTYTLGIEGRTVTLTDSNGKKQTAEIPEDANDNTTYTLTFKDNKLALTPSDGKAQEVDLSSLKDDTNTTYTIGISGRTVTLTPSVGDPQSFDLPEDKNDNTTYTLSINGRVVTLTPSTGDPQTITLPEDKNDNTTYTLGFKDGVLTLTGSDKKTQNVDLNDYATKKYVDDKFDQVGAQITVLTSNLIGKTLVFKQKLKSIQVPVTEDEFLLTLPTTGEWDIYQDGTKIQKCTVSDEVVNQVVVVGIIKYAFKELSSVGTPSDKIVYLDGYDNKNYTPFAMDLDTGVPNYGSWKNAFFMPKSCMLKYDGTVDYYLNEDDETKKLDGTASDISNEEYEGNVMVEFPHAWVKVEPDVSDPTTWSVMVSNYQLDENYHDWAFHSKSGKSQKHFYMPKYNSSLVDDRFRSLSGKSIPGKTSGDTADESFDAAGEITKATANGEGWYTETKAQVDYINFLLILMAKTTNVQTAYGNGYANNYYKSEQLADTGTLDGKGMFYGTSGNVGVKVFGMEHWWANQWRRYAGHIYDKGTSKVKLTWGTEDGSSVTGYNTTGEGYVSIPDSKIQNAAGDASGNGYVKQFTATASGAIVPTGTVNGSATTNYCDYNWYNNDQVNYADHGGTLRSGLGCGVFFLALNSATGYRWWALCAGISFTPENQELEVA